MRTIKVKYVTEGYLNDLEQRVNKEIKKGWKLVGNVTVVPHRIMEHKTFDTKEYEQIQIYFVQAMIYEE